MTQTAIRLMTKVLPGKRIEVTAPELVEGGDVELIVLQSESIAAAEESPSQEPQGVWDWLQSLAPPRRTAEEWTAIEREIDEERDSWDR